jgi:hypothetical protein
MTMAIDLLSMCDTRGFHASEHEVVAILEQRHSQHDNPSVALYRIRENVGNLTTSDLLLVEDSGDANYYRVTGGDRELALKNPTEWLGNMAGEWADNTDEPQLERLRWGLDKPESLHNPDCPNDCRILRVGSYYGYTPIDWVRNEDGDQEPLEFANAKAAQKWIDEAKSGTYHLSHNEAGRPTYYIV